MSEFPLCRIRERIRELKLLCIYNNGYIGSSQSNHHLTVLYRSKEFASQLRSSELGDHNVQRETLPHSSRLLTGTPSPRNHLPGGRWSGPCPLGMPSKGEEAPGVPATGQFMRIQNVGQKKAEESPAEIIIQVRIRRNTRNLGCLEGCGFGVFWDVTGRVKPK